MDSSRREFLRNLPLELAEGLRRLFGVQSERFNPGTTAGRMARINVHLCTAWSGSLCQLCYLACPRRDKAIRMEDLKPMVVSAACDGCAMCEAACRTVNHPPAVEIIPRPA